MGYSINGVPLHNPSLGWRLLSPSEPRSTRARDRIALSGPGRDGRARLRGSVPAPTFTLKVATPAQYLESLLALFRQASTVLFDGPPVITADCDWLSSSPRKVYDDPTGGRYDVGALLDLPDVYWRALEETTSEPAPIGSASVAVDVFPGISAPVRDAVIRLAGGVTGTRVDGADGTFFTYAPLVPIGSFLRFQSATGQAWVTATDTWTGGTEVSGSVFTGPGPYPFELDVADPLDLAARFTITTAARSGSPSVQVRGRSAHDH